MSGDQCRTVINWLQLVGDGFQTSPIIGSRPVTSDVYRQKEPATVVL